LLKERQFFILGNFVFGVLPLAYGIWDNGPELLSRIQHHKILGNLFPVDNDVLTNGTTKMADTTENLVTSDSTFTVLQYYWISLCLQVHLFQTLFAQQLRKILLSVNTKRFYKSL